MLCILFFAFHMFVLLPLPVSPELLTLKQSLGNGNNDNPSSFPPNFLFGTASSAYQYEGGYLSDGKGLNNWDVYTHRPEGRFGNVNVAGIDFYNNLIDALLLKGIKPFVTLTHIDLPQEIEDRYGSWLNICFKFFGDRVKYWVTFNEPNFQVKFGYREGTFPPSRCSFPFGNCTNGDSEKEPFIAAHNIILSHAAAVHIYRSKYQAKQGGSIGIVINAAWFEPISSSMADKLAAERAQCFTTNWFLDPIVFRRYPPEMQSILGSILPEFSKTEKEMLKKGLDFIGINHYSSYYVQDCMFTACEPGTGTSKTEGLWAQSYQKNGIPIGEPTDVDWLYVYPGGMEKIITYVKKRFNNTPMIITENGYGEVTKANSTIEDSLQDVNRAKYMAGYLDSLSTAIRKGADVRGYFAWSLLDNFEWEYGFTRRFGLHHVDFKTLKRTPKFSATWYKIFIAEHGKVKYQTADHLHKRPYYFY
ncbi:beta-glucosidase 46-like [Gossypium australe]|uniref:Beta-glucosidase 46-like n=1 Tax=Gossypium australe TaxID=47621 RepID=A0A5B6WAE6_9ROSI|nr:beta-glucosidase 46-like [Gossypium australe]